MENKNNIDPDHYKNNTSIECIDAMIIAFGPHTVINFCICNAWKYIWRWKHKNGIEDLYKAEWYCIKARNLVNVYGTSEKGECNEDIMIDRLKNYIYIQITKWEAEHEQKESD